MGAIHKFRGEIGSAYDWEGQRFRAYGNEGGLKDVTVRWLIGRPEEAPNFAIRYFEIAPGGHSRAEQHPHDHGVIILRGRAKVRLGDEEHEVGPMDVVYVSPNEWHQLTNIGEETLGFICVIPARLMREGREVWAEGD